VAAPTVGVDGNTLLAVMDVTPPFAAAFAISAAFAEGTAENPAIANADAATSAMRFVIVFVDIIFLSIKVAIKNFLIAAWPKMPVS
jgi:hypothetical protein